MITADCLMRKRAELEFTVDHGTTRPLFQATKELSLRTYYMTSFLPAPPPLCKEEKLGKRRNQQEVALLGRG